MDTDIYIRTCTHLYANDKVVRKQLVASHVAAVVPFEPHLLELIHRLAKQSLNFQRCS